MFLRYKHSSLTTKIGKKERRLVRLNSDKLLKIMVILAIVIN
jgi:hypothetical protein